MSDILDTPEPPKRNKGWFVKGDPRRSVGGSRRKTADGKSLTSLAREHTEEGLALLVQFMRDENMNSKVRLDAVKELFNRGWGNAHQQITIDGQVTHAHTATIDPTALSPEMREQLMLALHPTHELNIQNIRPDAIEYQPLDEGDDDIEH